MSDPRLDLRRRLLASFDPLVRRAYDWVVTLELDDAAKADRIEALEARVAELEDEVERASLNSKLQSRLARRALHKVADLEDEVERLTESRRVIAGALEREEERNADLEARVAELETALSKALRVGLPPHDASGSRMWDDARAALAAEKGQP